MYGKRLMHQILGPGSLESGWKQRLRMLVYKGYYIHHYLATRSIFHGAGLLDTYRKQCDQHSEKKTRRETHSLLVELHARRHDGSHRPEYRGGSLST